MEMVSHSHWRPREKRKLTASAARSTQETELIQAKEDEVCASDRSRVLGPPQPGVRGSTCGSRSSFMFQQQQKQQRKERSGFDYREARC